MFSTPTHKEKIIADAKRLAEDVQYLFNDVSTEKKKEMGEAADALREHWTQVQDRAQMIRRRVDRAAHENVWATAGVAALAGVIVGLLAAGASRRRHW